MKIILILLFFSIATYSQTEKSKAVKALPIKIEIKKITEIKKPVNKEELKNVEPKNNIPKNLDALILNDTIVTITKKSIATAPIEEKQLSYDVAFRLLNACNTSKLKKFTEFELAPNLLKKITLNYISAICVNNNEEYGKFLGITLAEVLTNENIKTNIYRYKIDYERKLLKKEMRIYINNLGLVSVIKSLKWKDNFELKKKPKPKTKKVLDSLTIIDESFIIRN